MTRFSRSIIGIVASSAWLCCVAGSALGGSLAGTSFTKTVKWSEPVVVVLEPVLDSPSELGIDDLAADIDISATVFVPDSIPPPAPNFPGDPGFAQQWGLNNTAPGGIGIADSDIDAPEAWAHHTGGLETVVAIVDTGVDMSHPDLYLNIWINQEEIPGYYDRCDPDAVRKVGDIYDRLVDVDGDCLITFWDLNDPINRGPDTIDDHDLNGFVDAHDILRRRECIDPYGPEDKDLDGDGVPDGENDPAPDADIDCSQRGWSDHTDADGNGYVDDLVGWDFDDDDNDPSDRNFHGTHVAGIVGAVGDQPLPTAPAIGVAGVNWRVSLLPLRIFPPEGSVKILPWQWKSLSDVEEFIMFLPRVGKAIRYAADHSHISNHSYTVMFPELDQAVLINFLTGIARGQISWMLDLAYRLAQPGLLEPLQAAMDYAEAKGHLAVVAAGNGEGVKGTPFQTDAIGDDLGELPYYPASFDNENIIVVAASDRSDEIASFSNFGRQEVDLAAPGVSILSTTPLEETAAMADSENSNGESVPVNEATDSLSGTSMAAPHVAGVAALVRNWNPSWTHAQVRDQLLEMVDPLPNPDDHGRVRTGGRLNALRAISPGAYFQRIEVLTANGPTRATDFADQCGEVPAIYGLRVHLNEALDASEFDTNDVELNVSAGDTVPAWALGVYVLDVVTAPSAAAIGEDRAFDVFFTEVVAAWNLGTLRLDFTIGPNLLDLDGDPMDLDRDGALGEFGDDAIHVPVRITRGFASDVTCESPVIDVLDDLIVVDVGPFAPIQLPDLGDITTDITSDLALDVNASIDGDPATTSELGSMEFAR